MNKLELIAFRKQLGLTQTEFANLFEKCKMRTVQNWESGNTPVPEHVELIIQRELEKLNAPYFAKNTPKQLSVVSEPQEGYGLKKENLELKKEIQFKDEQIVFYKDKIEFLENKIYDLESGQKKQNGTS